MADDRAGVRAEIDQIDERLRSDGDTDDGVLADLAVPTGEGRT